MIYRLFYFIIHPLFRSLSKSEYCWFTPTHQLAGVVAVRLQYSTSVINLPETEASISARILGQNPTTSETYRTRPSFGKVFETPIYGHGNHDRNSSPLAAISQPKIHANALADGAPPRTPLGSLQCSPDLLLYWIWLLGLRKGIKDGRTGQGERGIAKGREVEGTGRVGGGKEREGKGGPDQVREEIDAPGQRTSSLLRTRSSATAKVRHWTVVELEHET